MFDTDDLETPNFFPATRNNALKRMQAFSPQMGRAYADQRNSDFGPDDRSNISCLSPFIAHRLLLESEAVACALSEHSAHEAEKFTQEVYWRTYFKGWLELRPSVWPRYKKAVQGAIDGLTSERKRAYEQAMAGETEIACFNAWAKELVDTGYLHNHARMWFASIWIFTLRLPWALGADFFYRHLLDGDAASNTLSWRWVAGLHTRGKNYVARASNIRKYTEGRFNPEGQLAVDPAPLDDEWNGKAGGVPVLEPPEKGKKTILLLHEDDCGWDSLDLSGLELVGVAGITVTDDRSPFGASELAKQFAIEAVEDALNRADDGLPVSAVKLASTSSLIDLAQETGAEQVVYPYAPVGPVQDRLNASKPAWSDAGLTAREILRDYDRAAWPYCNKGFFGLKSKIPELIRTL
ncbi:MAG: FAD-binding domain-containing protein [Pseudomonadota bacterium]